jgi:DNA-binding GntR family transcriptional regulator
MAVGTNERRSALGSPLERNAPEGLPAVVARSLRDEVEDVLRQAIWRGDLRPGEHLNEAALADRLGVSRPPLREVIRTLEAEGLVVSRPRRGAYVKQLSGDDVLEIYSVRCTLEAMAAELVIDQSAVDVTDMLEEKLTELEHESLRHADLPDVITIDLQFHRAFVAAAGNSRLLHMWERLVGELRLALSLVPREFYDADFVHRTHRPLVEAIRAGDRVQAQTMIEELMVIGQSLYERWAALERTEDVLLDRP